MAQIMAGPQADGDEDGTKQRKPKRIPPSPAQRKPKRKPPQPKKPAAKTEEAE